MLVMWTTEVLCIVKTRLMKCGNHAVGGSTTHWVYFSSSWAEIVRSFSRVCTWDSNSSFLSVSCISEVFFLHTAETRHCHSSCTQCIHKTNCKDCLVTYLVGAEWSLSCVCMWDGEGVLNEKRFTSVWSRQGHCVLINHSFYVFVCIVW